VAETYTPITWTNGSGQPISAANLNRIETGIEAIDDRVAALEAGGVGGGVSATVVDAKGDLIAASTADTVTRLPVGANGSVLTADSATTTGLAWTGVAMSQAERDKLLTVNTGATANSSDATLLNRANHTGTQPVTSLTASGTPSAATFLRGDGAWAPAGSTGQVVSGYIPADTTTPTVTHSLGTTDLAISVHDETTGGYPLFSAASTSVNAVQFTFSSPTTANRYRYTIISNSAALSAPQVRDTPVVQAYAASLTLNAAAGNNRVCTATGNLTLNDPANGADGQLLLLRVIASGAQRVVTFAGTLKRPSAIASTVTIANGLRGDIGLYYESAYGWTVRAAQVA
jgi:hypothetical protein